MRKFMTMDEAEDIMVKLNSEKPGLKGNFQIVLPGDTKSEKDVEIVLMSGAKKVFVTAMLAISMMTYIQ